MPREGKVMSYTLLRLRISVLLKQKLVVVTGKDGSGQGQWPLVEISALYLGQPQDPGKTFSPYLTWRTVAKTRGLTYVQN